PGHHLCRRSRKPRAAIARCRSSVAVFRSEVDNASLDAARTSVLLPVISAAARPRRARIVATHCGCWAPALRLLGAYPERRLNGHSTANAYASINTQRRVKNE